MKNNKTQKSNIKATPAKSTEKPVFSKKDFRESPFVEKFYKTIYDHKLREHAYKTAIEVYLSRKHE